VNTFDSAIYGPTVAALLRDVAPAPLNKGAPRPEAKSLALLTPGKLFAHASQPVRDEKMAELCLAGLWLRHNYFDESHRIAQEIETPTGSFWHGILHRREPDYGNARYWFRRVGVHPIQRDLAQAAVAAGWPQEARWDNIAFVDRVEQTMRSEAENPARVLCLAIQQREWEILFDFCWRQALGG
jgi:hypothetical protein